MRFLRFLRGWWRETAVDHAGVEESLRSATTQTKPRVHRKMLPVVRYLEKIHNRNSDLKFRYVGPNQMNGDAEELQVFFSGEDQERGLTIRYLDRLGLYFIDGPHDEKLHQMTAREVLASLSALLAEFVPGEEFRNAPSARNRSFRG